MTTVDIPIRTPAVIYSCTRYDTVDTKGKAHGHTHNKSELIHLLSLAFWKYQITMVQCNNDADTTKDTGVVLPLFTMHQVYNMFAHKAVAGLIKPETVPLQQRGSCTEFPLCLSPNSSSGLDAVEKYIFEL